MSTPGLQHIGIIIDGNRRWATEKNLPAFKGHQQGYETVKSVMDYAFAELKIPFMTIYAFSTENWKRSEKEVKFLMNLAMRMATRDLDEIHSKNIKLKWLGTRERLSKKIQELIEKSEERTKNNTGGTLSLCFNYGGHQEIVDAVNKIDGEVTEEAITANLYGPEVPDIDLMIRTSGEQRLSNFMLWRMSYAEMLFLDTYWPDFSNDDLKQAIQDYNNRQRRFGN